MMGKSVNEFSHNGRCQLHNTSLDTGGKCARCEIIKQVRQVRLDGDHLSNAEIEKELLQAELDITGLASIVGKRGAQPISYIATYSAHCIDGSAIQANLALSSVPAGTSPGSMIEMVTEQAYADIARSGKNATQVVVLNLSRVW